LLVIKTQQFAHPDIAVRRLWGNGVVALGRLAATLGPSRQAGGGNPSKMEMFCQQDCSNYQNYRDLITKIGEIMYISWGCE